MTSAPADRFAATLGSARGAGRPAGDPDPALMTDTSRRRRVLALIAAHGILGHNSAVEMPDRFSAGRVAALVEHGGRPDLPTVHPVSDELHGDLDALAAAGLLRSFKDAWQVTPAGLVELWAGSSPA